MSASPEFMTVNLLDTATLTESSEESSLPAENVQSVHRTKVWRSKPGWNIVAGVNDKLDFDDGAGELTATLTAGNYATSAVMATEVETQMGVEATTGVVIEVSYGSRKFTIENTLTGGTLELLWNSGTNATTSCGEDLGYDTSSDADATGVVSHVSDDETRCSREWIGMALAAATQCKRCVIVSHNFSSSAVVTLFRHTSDDLSAATAVDTITYDADFMVLEFDATYKHWWIHVDDIDNADSYIEIGRAFLGDYDVLTAALGDALRFGKIDPGLATFTPEGVAGKHERTHYFAAQINLRLMDATDRDVLLTIHDRVGAYKHFFMRLDPGESTFSQARLGGMYGYFSSSGMSFDARMLPTVRYSLPLTVEEAR